MTRLSMRRRSGTKRLLDRLHGRYVFSRRIEVLSVQLAPLIPPDARLLDVGSGDGLLAYRLGQLRPDLSIEGIDVFVRADTHIPIRPFDGKVLPFPDHAFDAVMFVDVLHHAEEPLTLLREALRVARQAVVVKDHRREGFLAGSTLSFMDWVGNARHGVALPHNYWSDVEWDRSLSSLGARVTQRNEHIGLYPVPANFVFERSLHVILVLIPAESGTLDSSTRR